MKYTDVIEGVPVRVGLMFPENAIYLECGDAARLSLGCDIAERVAYAILAMVQEAKGQRL